MGDKIEKISKPDTAKGAPAPKVTPSVPLREGARAPQVVTPTNVPKTPGPVSVTPNKK